MPCTYTTFVVVAMGLYVVPRPMADWFTGDWDMHATMPGPSSEGDEERHFGAVIAQILDGLSLCGKLDS